MLKDTDSDGSINESHETVQEGTECHGCAVIRRTAMSAPPRVWPALGLVILLAGLAAIGWLGWWLFGKVHALSSSLDPAFIIWVVAFLVCTAMIVWAIYRNGASRAARLRCQAEVYEAALILVLRASARPVNAAEWRRIRARLFLWGSRAVLRQFTNLEADRWSLDMDQPTVPGRLAALIRAMRADLGQRDIGLAAANQKPEEEEETEEEAQADEEEDRD